MLYQNLSSNFYVPRAKENTLEKQIRDRNLGIKEEYPYRKNFKNMGIFSKTRLNNIYWRYRDQYYPKGLPTIK